MPTPNDDRDEDDRLSRRSTLVRAGGLAAAALGAASLPAEAAGSDAQSDAVACVLSPEMTEGPYYLPNEKVRRNITEGLPGAPLTLQPDRRQRLQLHTDQGRRGRHLARERRRANTRARRPTTPSGSPSCAESSAPTPRGSRSSRPSTPAGTRAAPCTST